MNKHLPFFNWSLKKALDTEPDNFGKARIKIIFTILLFSLFKILLGIILASASEQWMQVNRAVIALVFYIALLKVLFYAPSRINILSHIMLLAGLAIVISNIFVFSHKVNLLSAQFVLMMILCGFYTLGIRWGIFYSVVGTLPVVVFFALNGSFNTANVGPEEMASPAYEIIAFSNFVSIAVAHYLFYNAFHHNIREKEVLNKQLELSIAQANKLAVSRTNFLSTMSHELRTPLNSVVGITELLIEDKPTDHQKDNLKILRSSTLDLLSLINNVLDFNKIDSDKLELEKTPFRLKEFMNNICSGLRIKANDKRLDFILDIDDELETIVVTSDPTRLSQVIYNLAGNAIKFTDKGNVTIRLKCLRKTTDAVDVLFTVSDTGIGIHPERHAAIFELFTQAESDTTRKYGGTGLGLAIVKQVLTLFKSNIELESDTGNGATFSFPISFALAEENHEPVKLTTDRSDLSHLKILIAEDNEVNQLIMKQQLDNLNIHPVMVGNGEEAYDACLAGSYDAVFMDLHMPVQDGYETTRKIRASSNPHMSKVYLIAFTASVTEQQHILENGFDDFLYKPVSMSDLREKLEKITLRNKPVSV